MKNDLKLFSILLLFIPFCLGAQVIPLNFLNVMPEWVYVPEDSNFVASPSDLPGLSKYSGLNTWRLDIKENRALFFCPTLTPRLERDGFIYYALELNTGTADWILHHNANSGIKNLEFHLIPSFHFHEDEAALDMVGLKSFDTIDPVNFKFDHFTKPVFRTIDLSSGVFTQEIEVQMEPYEAFHNWASLIPNIGYKRINGKYLNVSRRPYIENDTLKDAIEVRRVVSPFTIDTSSYTAVVNNTMLVTDVLSLSRLPIINHVNDSMVVGLFSIQNPEDFQFSPEKLWVSQFVLDEDGNITVKKELDITDEVFYPQDFANRIVSTHRDGHVFVFQSMDDVSNVTPASRFTWFLWLDKDCNKKLKIDALHVGDRYYIEPIVFQASDEKIQLYASFTDSIAGIRGFDLLEIRSSGEIVRLGGFHLNINSNRGLLVQQVAIAPDGGVVVAFRTQQFINSVFTDYCYFMKFDKKILEPAVGTSVEEIAQTSHFSVSPNPTSDYLRIDMHADSPSAAQGHIFDLTGRLLLRAPIEGTDAQIDLRSLGSGVYVLRLVATDGTQIGSAQKFYKQ